MDSEEEWVETFTWVASNSRNLYSLGPRELANVESLFTRQSKIFVKRHQAARDMLHDSEWVTRWMMAMTYVVVITWGAMRLYQDRESEIGAFEPGDFVLLLEVYHKFGKYL